ncbi:MAG TPA: hypothetical protein VIL69_17795 [Roseomonas sp.]
MPLGIPILRRLCEYKLICERKLFDGVRDYGEPGDVCAISMSHARYIGFTNPVDVFRDIDVLLAPSIWHEPFDRITIEALFRGLPDIVTEGMTG